jgi:Fe-S oxidoreductase
MGLEACRSDMDMCHRCSACKFIPLEKVRGWRYAYACPSIARYNFHAYSGGGRIATVQAFLDGRFEYSKSLLDIVYNCQMCGACDVSCKYAMDMEVLEPIGEFRMGCVDNRQTLPSLDEVISGLRHEGTMVAGRGNRRGDWIDELGIRDINEKKAKVVYYSGCRTSLDPRMWKIATSTVSLLEKAGVDYAVVGRNETCCGGRAYHMGYREDFLRQARLNAEFFRQWGAEVLLTGCSECYHTFKVLYDKLDLNLGLEVLHSTQYLHRLIRENKLKPSKEIRATITYHDPCHLGRLGEPYVHWNGERVPGHMFRFDPPKVYRRGTYGVYEPPREILRNIPGLQLVEMDRTREYAWCCGSGGGVKESNPEFATWTARERIEEAVSTGAHALVSACPGCERNFSDALEESGRCLAIYDVVELLDRAV